MVRARTVGGDVTAAVAQSVGWEEVAQIAATATNLTAAIDADPIDHLGSGYYRFRRYAPRMLDALELRGGRSANPFLAAVVVLHDLNRCSRTDLPPQRAGRVRILEVEAAARPIENRSRRSAHMGDGAFVPSARCLAVRRRLARPLPSSP